MSVAIDADDTQSLRAEVETEYQQNDPEVPYESEASYSSTSYANNCC